MCGAIRLSFFRKYITGASTRGKSWNITPEEADKRLKSQNYKCALSGLEISANGPLELITASLDRIVNTRGYESDNIQWVHKEINMMRGPMEIAQFKNLCRLVSAQ